MTQENDVDTIKKKIEASVRQFHDIPDEANPELQTLLATAVNWYQSQVDQESPEQQASWGKKTAQALLGLCAKTEPKFGQMGSAGEDKNFGETIHLAVQVSQPIQSIIHNAVHDHEQSITKHVKRAVRTGEKPKSGFAVG